MKAAVLHDRHDIRVEQVPDLPEPAPGRVVVKVKWCGICGSDLREYTAAIVLNSARKPHPHTGQQAPLIMGHEFSGDVVAIGAGVTRLKIGDRVTANTFETCGACYWCRHGQPQICSSIASTGLRGSGAFAEYVDVAEAVTFRLPDQLSYEAAAIAEPFAVALHAVRRGGVEPGSVVGVLGAGPIGLGVLQAARAVGATDVIALEVARQRSELARSLGASEILDPRDPGVVRRIRAATERSGVDVSFDCAGVPASPAMAVDILRRGGRAVIIAIQEQASEIHFNKLVFVEKQVIGSMGSGDEFPVVLSLLAAGKLQAEPLITAKIPLRDVAREGFDALLERKGVHVKILVSPEGG